MHTEKKIVKKGCIFLRINSYDMNIATEAIYDSSTSCREKRVLRGLHMMVRL